MVRALQIPFEIDGGNSQENNKNDLYLYIAGSWPIHELQPEAFIEPIGRTITKGIGT